MQNINPVFAKTPDSRVGGSMMGTTAQTGTVPSQGIDANTLEIFQADVTDGSFVESITLKPVGACAATVIRLYLYTGSSGTFTPGTSNTVANTALIDEMMTVANTASATQSQNTYVFTLNKRLAPGQRLLIGFGTSTGSSGNGFAVTVWGGKYN